MNANLAQMLIDDYIKEETQKRNKEGSLKLYKKACLQSDGRTIVGAGFNPSEENTSDLFNSERNDMYDGFYDEDDEDEDNSN